MATAARSDHRGRTKLRNRVPAAVLRSRLHRLMSGRTVLVSFTGRRSGRTFTTPVNYLRSGDEVLIATDSAWWRNLTGGAPVTLWLRGERVETRAEVIEDPEEATTALVAIVRDQPRYGRWAHVAVHDGEPDVDDARAEVRRGRHVIRLHLPKGAA